MKIKTIKTLLLLCFSFYQINMCCGQNDTIWSEVVKKNAVSINIAGTTPFLGITYERLITNQLNVEVGLGVYSVGAAITYFPFPIYKNKMVFHTALGSNIFATPFDTFGSGDFSNTNYLAVGLSYFGREGFNFGLGIGPSINYDFTFDEYARSIYGNLKIGYRF